MDIERFQWLCGTMIESEEAQKARTVQRAWYLAMSGEHLSWREVEAGLLSLGFNEAAKWLSDPRLRQRLDETCKAAREELFRNHPRP